MENCISLIFDNDIFGTVLLSIDESSKGIGCIATKANYHSLALSNSSVIFHLKPAKRKQAKEFDDLLSDYAPTGRAFFTSYRNSPFENKGKSVRSIKDLVIGKKYYNNEFSNFLRGGALIYKGIFPGTLENFYDLYKDVMFEEALKVAKGMNEEVERELRDNFKSIVENK